jgi:hypothetical protein
MVSDSGIALLDCIVVSLSTLWVMDSCAYGQQQQYQQQGCSLHVLTTRSFAQVLVYNCMYVHASCEV